MRMVNRIMLAIVLLPALVLILMPKKEIYYMLEHKLQAQHIVISGEKLDSGLFTFKIEHPNIYYMGSVVASADSIDLLALLLYNEIDAKRLVLAKGLATELEIQNIKFRYSFISPKKINMSGIGSIGKIQGYISLDKKILYINASKVGADSNIARYMKKTKEGWTYESRF